MYWGHELVVKCLPKIGVGVLLDLDRHVEPETVGADVSSGVGGVGAFPRNVHFVGEATMQVGQECVSAGVLGLGSGQAAVPVLVPELPPEVAVAALQVFAHVSEPIL